MVEQKEQGKGMCVGLQGRSKATSCWRKLWKTPWRKWLQAKDAELGLFCSGGPGELPEHHRTEGKHPALKANLSPRFCPG